MNKITLTYIDNISHGYIKISKYDLKSWGIDEKQFSHYSYYNNDNACLYLEEDCDGTTLIKLLKNKGYEISYKNKCVNHNYFDHPIFNRLSSAVLTV